MNKSENYNELKNLALSEGMSLFGVADISEARNGFLIPEAVKNKFGNAISLGNMGRRQEDRLAWEECVNFHQ